MAGERIYGEERRESLEVIHLCRSEGQKDRRDQEVKKDSLPFLSDAGRADEDGRRKKITFAGAIPKGSLPFFCICGLKTKNSRLMATVHSFVSLFYYFFLVF
jgi:hypothetical protein